MIGFACEASVPLTVPEISSWIQLSEIYNWITEGFDTADLKDAKALLDSLSDKR